MKRPDDDLGHRYVYTHHAERGATGLMMRRVGGFSSRGACVVWAALVPRVLNLVLRIFNLVWPSSVRRDSLEFLELLGFFLLE